MNAREEVLGRVRTAVAGGAGPAPVARDYRTAGQPRDLAADELLELLVDRLVDYRALVRRSTTALVAASVVVTAVVATIGSRGGVPVWLSLPVTVVLALAALAAVARELIGPFAGALARYRDEVALEGHEDDDRDEPEEQGILDQPLPRSSSGRGMKSLTGSTLSRIRCSSVRKTRVVTLPAAS